jgi:hypothetical protein
MSRRELFISQQYCCASFRRIMEAMGIPAERAWSGRYWMRMLGIVSLALAAVLFLGGVVVFLAGNEAAILALIVAFGALTFGTGALAASRRM